MVRVPTDIEYGNWLVALESQTADNVKATYVRPAPASIPNPKKVRSLSCTYMYYEHIYVGLHLYCTFLITISVIGNELNVCKKMQI